MLKELNDVQASAINLILADVIMTDKSRERTILNILLVLGRCSAELALGCFLGDFGASGKDFGRVWERFWEVFRIQNSIFEWSWASFFDFCSHLLERL